MNSSWSRDPASRVARCCVALAALVAVSGCACGGIDRRSYNDAALFLHDVPVAATESSSGAASSEARAKRSFSLTLDGAFTLTERSEKKLPLLGVDFADLDPQLADRLGVEAYSGVVVRGVVENSAAARAGIRADDVIMTFQGISVGNPSRVRYLTEQEAAGALVELEVRRGTEKLQMSLELGSSTMLVDTRTLERNLPVLDDRARTGLRFVEVTDDVGSYILGPGATGGGLLVVESLPGGPGFQADLRIRDCLQALNERPVKTLADYHEILRDLSSGDEIRVSVLRDGLELEKTLVVCEDALETGSFNFLGLVKHRSGHGWGEFRLLWGFLFNSCAYDSVRKQEDFPQNSSQWCWGSILDLVQYRSTPKVSELRLLWIFPISSSRD